MEISWTDHRGAYESLSKQKKPQTPDFTGKPSDLRLFALRAECGTRTHTVAHKNLNLACLPIPSIPPAAVSPTTEYLHYTFISAACQAIVPNFPNHVTAIMLLYYCSLLRCSQQLMPLNRPEQPILARAVSDLPHKTQIKHPENRLKSGLPGASHS